MTTTKRGFIEKHIGMADISAKKPPNCIDVKIIIWQSLPYNYMLFHA